MVVCCCLRNRASKDSHLPVGSWTLAATMAWVWSWGSMVREVCWRNSAAVIPRVSTWWTPSVPRRVTAPWVSNHPSAASTAASWAARTSARTHGSGVSAHSTEIDFGAENVQSNPRADVPPKRRPSFAPRRRVEAVEQRPQLLARDLAVEAERPCPRTPPPSRRLVGVEVVVDRPTARTTGTLPVLGEARVVVEQLPESVVRRLQRLAPHHRDVPARPNALVCVPHYLQGR